MADDKLEVPSKAQSIEALATGPLASSISKLSGSSRAIPSDQDFHFFLNFDQFSQPLQQIAEKSHSMLESVASSALACAKTASPPAMALPEDTDDAYDRLVDVNDAILERFDASLDELRSYGDGDGFHLVTAKKKKAVSKFSSGDGLASEVVKVATIDKRANGSKPKVPFHIPTIRKPQEEFNIFVCNANKPFDHVWLQRTEDGQRFIHPLENVSVLDFVDDETVDSKTLKPPSVESTEFKLIEEVKDLKELAAKLRGVSEFAVDLEHNQYRSFQGLTCLIQISTRMEDFVIDALKLRIHIGPYLREVFKDPTKRKVMHGADRDIVWLQRDFGIYICNLFDTGQASRVLKLEKNSLEYLLHHFCGVIANKEYQNADWRLRPLPEEMLRYARDDTHYLLHIYDSMKIELHSMKELESPNASLLEVYKRSYDICMQLYEKELLTEDSYLYIYGLRGAGLNSQQLAIVAGLYEWRDVVARAEDESTGYILPNKALIEIAKQMPVTTSTLRRLVKTKHPYVEHNLGSVVSIIRNSMQNATAFEAAIGHLKDGLVGKVCGENLAIKKEPVVSKNNIALADSISNAESISRTGESCSDKIDSCNSSVANENLCDSASELRKDWSTSTSSDSEQVKGATVQVQKKPSHAFGALLGNKITKKRFELGGKDEQEAKLKQIRASVHYPFHNIAELLKPAMEFSVAAFEGPISDGQAATSDANSELNDMIIWKVDSDIDELGNNYSMTTRNVDNDLKVSASDIDKDEPLSLSDLSLSFQQCLNANRKVRRVNKGQESVGLQLKPFDYEAARRQVGFGDRSIEHREEGVKDERSLRGSKLKKNSDGAEAGKDDETAEYLQGRRRKAFPATGNRSATFR